MPLLGKALPALPCSFATFPPRSPALGSRKGLSALSQGHQALSSKGVPVRCAASELVELSQDLGHPASISGWAEGARRQRGIAPLPQ